MSTARLAVLISGRGSNLQALIDACADGDIDAHIVVVLSNNPDAAGLERAAAAGIDTCCVNHRNFDKREDFDRAMIARLLPFDVDLVILAGFMRILTPAFIDAYAGRLFNIHPSLLPKYPGLHTHQRAIDAGDTQAGVTVHFVTTELDGGPPVLQAVVPVLPTDSADELAARVVVQEHVIYPLAVRWFLQGRLQLVDGTAHLDGEPVPATGIRYVEGMR
ncbi:MAG: phosphoribosylglycinamide formyltransferase [Halioglobus sp.]|nr:phosphoribosylglycinamide formyltransferase [Halioglobus sp.]